MSDVNLHQIPAAQISREVAGQEYNKLIGGNEYKPGTGAEYGATHPNALSDGDEKGRGELNGQVGTKTDINEFKKLTSMNLFGAGKEYKNPDTI